MKRAVGEETFRRLSAPVDDESLESARCLFLLLFMLRGIPFVDIAYMRRCDMHGNVIAYRRRKTGAWLTVRVEPEAMELIRRLKNPDESSPYLFPFISRPGNNEYRQYQNALRHFNYCLGRLARDMSGVEGLSSYSARPQLGYHCQFQELSAGAHQQCHGTFLGQGNRNLLQKTFGQTNTRNEQGHTLVCL